MKAEIALEVNGRKRTVLVEPNRTLQDALRLDLEMTGTKKCCNDGYCGACTVMMDGKSVKSCLVFAVEAEGKKITTIEGLSRESELDPIQQAFIEHGASQCGMCTPGMIMSAKDLLSKNPTPTKEEIKEAIKGNLCRCTGYVKIIEAIESVASKHQAENKELSLAHAGKRWVGKSVRRVDGREKVTGKASYIIDKVLPGMLYGEILRSNVPHARIISVDTSEAEKLPGVMAVITGKDMANSYGSLVADETGLAVDKVRYVGDGIAAVAALTEEIATKALELIEVELEELPFETDLEKAMEEGAPLIHDAERNIVSHRFVVAGDVEQGFEEADYIFEDRFETTKQAHACMETHVCIAKWEQSNKITIYDSNQAPLFMKLGLAKVFDIPASKVRVITPYLGGGFGSKSEVDTIHVCASILSRKTGNPVKMGLTRDEEFTSSKTRHKEIIYMKTGVKKDGTITARQARAIIDNGAYTSYGPAVANAQSMLGGAVYRIPNYRYDGYIVYTNTPVGGAFRGFGSPQFTFAAESQMEMIANRLGLDPLELRRKNLTQPGDTAISGPVLTTNGAQQSMDLAAEAIGFDEKRKNKKPYHGVGLAVGTHFTSGKYIDINADFSGATVKVNADGSINVLSGQTEMGSGAATALSQIAAEVFGVDIDDIDLTMDDSASIPPDMGTHGSRGTTIGGQAVMMACQKAKMQIAEEAAVKFECELDRIGFENKQVFCQDDPSKRMGLAEIVANMLFDGGKHVMASAHFEAPCSLPDPETGVGDFAMAYTFGTHAAEVEVDPETGKVTLLDFVAATDCGNVINPAGAEAQVQGGAVQGIGYALYEDIKIRDGQPINTRFGNYKIPTVMTVPPIRSYFVETNDPRGTYGSKGLAEMGLVPTAPAIANAIEDAIGIRIQSLPITPEKILKALQEKNEMEAQQV